MAALNGTPFWIMVGQIAPPVPSFGPLKEVPPALAQKGSGSGSQGAREYRIVGTNALGQDTVPSRAIVAHVNPESGADVRNKLFWVPALGCVSYKILCNAPDQQPQVIATLRQSACWDAKYPSFCSYTDSSPTMPTGTAYEPTRIAPPLLIPFDTVYAPTVF